MAKAVFQQTRFQGIADYNKQSALTDQIIPDQVAFSRSVDMRTDPRAVSLLPATAKESGSVVIDLLKWADTPTTVTSTYAYGNAGYFYQRTSAGAWSNLHQVPMSHGNGLAYYGEDDFIYYTSDSVIGRYGPVSNGPTFTDDFLGAQGGVPTNTASLSLVAASSQYASRADTASLSITGNITLEAYINPTTLPAVGSTMALVSKWDESGATRSYIMDLLGVSGYFGSGADGALTISTDTTDAPIDSACTGTSGSQTLTATNTSFAANQEIFIHQTQGTGVGQWMRNTIQSYTAGTITLVKPLNATYVTGAQVLVLKQYTTVTVNSGKTFTAKAWNGTTGGILAFLANSTATISGAISASEKGFRGGIGYSDTNNTDLFAGTGEGTVGPSVRAHATNGNGGGGGFGNPNGGGGGGGGNGDVGSNGGGAQFGPGGLSVGSTGLTTMDLGGGGGGGGRDNANAGATGGIGGGIIFVSAATLTMSGGTIVSRGQDGLGASGMEGRGGGGAGGSILLKSQVATLGDGLITAAGGSGSSGSGNAGGSGAVGIIHLDYLTSFTGTTSPALNATQDNTLVTTTSYQARLGVSNNGTSFEYLTQLLSPSFTTGTWNRLSIAWVASTSTATFYLNGVSQGTNVGTKTSISDNASTFQIGMNKGGAGTATNFYNGLIDDVRVWNIAQSAANILAYNSVQLTGSEAGLVAYYVLNSAYTDSTANGNDLTATNSPTFSTNVPFAGATTRLDIDITSSGTGHTYTPPTTIIESAANEFVFTPTKDPQKSIDILIATKGTGDWTVTVHDAQNRLIASKTIANASLGANGTYTEFVFATPWRPAKVGVAQYHFHVTSTVADGTMTTGADNSMANPSAHTYFGFLVTDSDFHPIKPMLNFLAIGNERYVATWDGVNYLPNNIVLPAGQRVRALSYFREYLAIGVWKGTQINSYEFGRVYFWDGISTTFNFFIDVPEGAIDALLGTPEGLYIWAGYQGDLLLYQGGSYGYNGGARSNKIKRLPYTTQNTYTEIFPGAVALWRTLTHFGVAGNSNSSAVQKGVYSWGSVNLNFPPFLSYDYPISTGNRTTTVSVGMVYPIGSDLLIGWQDGAAFGADVVDPAGAPFSNGTIECLIRDEDAIWRDQFLSILRGDFLALNTGESVDIKYQVNRSGTWVGLPAGPVTNASENYETSNGYAAVVLNQINNARSREYQVAFDLFTTVSTSPTMLGISVQEDKLEEEQSF